MREWADTTMEDLENWVEMQKNLGVPSDVVEGWEVAARKAIAEAKAKIPYAKRLEGLMEDPDSPMMLVCLIEGTVRDLLAS